VGVAAPVPRTAATPEKACLTPGKTYSVAPKRAHLAKNAGGSAAVFFVLQGVGEYDLSPLPSGLLSLHGTENHGVGGSIPPLGTKETKDLYQPAERLTLGIPKSAAP
jgi:hypothetical protein